METKQPKFNLQPGAAYRVRVRYLEDINTHRIGYATRRIFKGMETRFGSIPCYVFTSKCGRDITGEWNPETKELRITGPSTHGFPMGELSVPEYDIVTIEAG